MGLPMVDLDPRTGEAVGLATRVTERAKLGVYCSQTAVMMEAVLVHLDAGRVLLARAELRAARDVVNKALRAVSA